MKQVVAALIMKDGRLLIAQRKETSNIPLKWEFPGGKTEEGETPQQCLVREIKEELDITIIVGKYFARNVHTYDNNTIELLVYWAEWVAGDIKLLDHNDLKWVSIQQLPLFDFAPADISVVDKLLVYAGTKSENNNT